MIMTTQLSPSESVEFYKRAARNYYFSLPVLACLPVLFWWIFTVTGTEFVERAFWYGALGWVIALVLRIPVTLVVRKLPKDKMEKIIIGSSGPLEEGVRLVLLLVTGLSFHWAASVGQGWAAVEVLYTVIAGMAQTSLMTRTDDKAVEARAILEQQFGGQKTTNPLYGLWERICGSAFHISCTLLIAWLPWFAIITAILHSAYNIFLLRVSKRSINAGAVLNLVISGVISGVAILVWTL